MGHKFADSRNYGGFKRASNKNNVQEGQALELSTRHTEEPRLVYWVVPSASPSFLQADPRNYSPSKFQVIKSPTSPLEIAAPDNLPYESNDSVATASPVSSSGVELFVQSKNSQTFDELLKIPSRLSSSNGLASAITSKQPSGKFTAESSDVLTENTSKADKTPKKSSQRKGKKKGKQRYRTRPNKKSTLHDVESEEHNNVLAPCNNDERAACSIQKTSSNDSHPVIPGKKGRRSKKTPKGENLNGTSKSRSENEHHQFRKNSSHSVWKKVEKTDSRSYKSWTHAPVSISPKIDDASMPSYVPVKCDLSVNLKNKNDRKCRYSFSGGSQTHNKESNQHKYKPKTPVNSIIGNSVSNVNCKVCEISKWINLPSCNESCNGYFRNSNPFQNYIIQNKVCVASPFMGYRTSCTAHCLSVPEQRISSRAEDKKPSNISCMSVSESLLHPIRESDLLPTGEDLHVYRNKYYLNDFDLAHYVNKHDLSGSCYEYMPRIQSERSRCTEVGCLYRIGHTQLQWLTSFEKQNPDTNILRETASKLSGMGTNLHHKIDADNIEQGISKSDDNNVFSCSCYSTTDAACSTNASIDFINKTGRHVDSDKKKSAHDTISNCENTEVREKEDMRFNIDVDRISQIVIGACKFHTEIDSNNQISGNPITDFQTFLSSASPILTFSSQDLCVEYLSTEEQITCSFCQHQVPNFSLKNLWQWYEEPSCFGLQVKVQGNQNPRWSSNSNSEFNAFFVPYLSSVQLFGNSRGDRCCNCAAATVASSTSLPTPQNEVSRCLSVLPSCASNKFLDQSLKSTDIREQVIFEYFESDQPSWRRPLFEKIKELVSGGSPNSRTFGDPKKLEHSNLHDLHHASWYSVAWYPICRIPDGKLRAAFLTYHSLGQLVHGSRPHNSGVISNVIAPVVGLQKYNDKGESWYQPRGSDKDLHSEEAFYSNASESINEGLRRLEHTASLMSRAVVSKEGNSSINRHPDYEFFVSRSR